MARAGGGNSPDLQIDLQILATLQDIASILKGGRGASILPLGGRGSGGGGNNLLADLSHLSTIVSDVARTVRLFGDAIAAVGQTMQELAQTRFGLGSSGSTSALAQLLGGAVGISDVAGLGASLQKASLSGLGMSIAGRYGIPYQPIELGGGVDRGEVIMKVIEGLRRTADTRGMNAAIGEARTLGGGAENLLPLTLLPPEELARVRELARLQADMYSPERITAGLRLNIALAEMNAQFQDMQSLLAGPLTGVMKVVNEMLRGKSLTDIAAEGISGLFGGKAPMDANTEAVNRNTAALEGWGAGQFGGGTRSRSAVPGAFGVDAGRGDQLDKYLRAGAFTLDSSSAGR